MIFRNLRTTLAIAGAVLALALAAPAPAAKFTITVDDGGKCDGSWETTGPANNPTVTCVSTGAPTCTATQSQTVTANTSVALAMANCSASNGATVTYAWYVGNTTGTPVSTGTSSYATPLLTTTTTYFGVATANGASATYPITLTVPAAGGAPTCTATQSQTVAANTSMVLTLANCSANNGASISYAWYLGGTGGTPVSTGSNLFTTPALTGTTTYSGVATANGLSTTYPVTLTVSPVTSTACGNYKSVVRLADITLDGRLVASDGMQGTAIAYGQITIPDPLPAGWTGRVSTISVFEYGSANLYRKLVLSKTACDFTPSGYNSYSGIGGNLYINYGSASWNAVTVRPGEVWYLNIKDEYPSGASSCPSVVNCNFGVTAWPPSL